MRRRQRRDVDARCVVEQNLAVEHDAAVVRPQQPGDHVDDAWSCRRPRGRTCAVAPLSLANCAFKRELAELFFDLDHAACQAPCRRAAARRANHSEAISAASEMIIATITSCSAALSPPGTCVSV